MDEGPRGLSETEALARRAAGLGNAAPPATARTYRAILRDNVLTFINAVVFGLALTLLALGQWSEALVSVGVVGINVAVGVVQEVRAKLVLDRIAILTRPRARVMRDGVERWIDPSEVVTGDTLVARLGDQIVVDGVLQSGAIDADESLLTGESEPVTRRAGDQVLSGSFCLRGEGRYEATHVGDASYANQIVSGARAHRRILTPLQRQIELVVRVLLFVAGSFAIILVMGAIIEGQPAVEIVRRAVVVVGLVPNGLFVAIATAYALGAARMARKGVLVQQTNAVESLSNVDVLCLDKTGTMTTGRLTLERARTLGTAPDDALRLLGDLVASTPSAGRTGEAIARACPGSRRASRDEAAFTSDTRWSGVAFADETGALVLGAPEVVLSRAAPAGRDAAEAEVADAAAAGLRVLVLGRAPVARFARDGARPALPERIDPLLMIGLRDELRPALAETLARFAERGVAVKLVSGDHPDTVRALAVAGRLAADGRVVTGDDLAALDDAELMAFAGRHALFARVAPREKARLIGALHAAGRYVAMIGDGVNDVPAMKRADVAIAINDGAQAARAVSDLVLLESSFAALPIAVGEGQRVLAGMQEILRLFLTRIGYVALLIAATALVGVGFPYTPKQSGLLSFFAVGGPAVVLVIIARPGQHVRERLVARLIRFVVPASWSLALVGLLVYVAYASASSVELAQSVLTLTTTLCGIAIAMFAAPPTRFWRAAGAPPAGWPAAILGAFLVAALGWILGDPSRRAFFDLNALSVFDVVVSVVVCAGWTVGMRWIWLNDAFERLLGIQRSSVADQRALAPEQRDPRAVVLDVDVAAHEPLLERAADLPIGPR